MREASQSERAEKLIGRVLSDRYRIDELVASGSMASVYLGLHLNMRKQVAIKILHPQAEDFPELVARFKREAVAGAHISHVNVAAASDMGTFDDGSYFLVLEYVRGKTLRDVIRENAPMEPARAVAIARQLAAALGASHAKGIIHRDLKPGNVMVTDPPDEVVKLIDFGLARIKVENVAPLPDEVFSPKKSLSAAGVVFGTVGYMAPETALGMKSVNERSDLYSLGVILYEMLTAEHPFSAVDPKELFQLHRSQKPPAPSERQPPTQIPLGLEALVMSLLEKDPSARPATAAKVIEGLDACLKPNDGPSEHIVTLPPPSRFPAKHVAFGVALVALFGISTYWLAWGRKDPVEPTQAVTSAPVVSAVAVPSASSAEHPIDLAMFGAKSNDDALVAEKLRGQFLKATDPDDAGALLVSLADVAPGALRDPATREQALRVAAQVANKNSTETGRVYYALSYSFGTQGLDVLYDLANGPPNTKPALRAATILDLRGAMDRATPALRLALDLNKSSCRNKPLLFAKATAEGDARALAILQKLQAPECDPKTSPCCFTHNIALERAIAVIQSRTATQ